MRCRSITRAVDEALTNIVRHSYGNRLDQPIALYFRSAKRCQHGEIEGGLEIRDREQIRPGGLGLHLDIVEFTRKGLTNQLRLVKYFAEASDAP
jgi:anti-sigma regulatory factor (Ser/Thr protein kinase)